jgi:hypothetical protein
VYSFNLTQELKVYSFNLTQKMLVHSVNLTGAEGVWYSSHYYKHPCQQLHFLSWPRYEEIFISISKNKLFVLHYSAMSVNEFAYRSKTV